MSNGLFVPPIPVNEVVRAYELDSIDRREVLKAYQHLNASSVDIPLYIGEQQIFTTKRKSISPPHQHQHHIGTYSIADKEHVDQAILSAIETKKTWSDFSFQTRASIFLKAADLIAGKYRYIINSATMLGQSKTIHQAEIDSACELIDFLRYNVHFAHQIYTEQPNSAAGTWNRMEYRPLEGFVYAITPFNFTAIAGNLPTAPALMGNTVVWKPSDSQVYTAKIIMDILDEAGLPKGVINMITGDPEMISDLILNHTEFSGLHFTGSTAVFNSLWQKIGSNISTYKSYPRIVGETGGKNFILAHPSADPKVLATAIIRGSFEYQGQKCSAASRVYIPKGIWNQLQEILRKEINSISIGSPENFKNFITSVIHEASYDKLVSYIEQAKIDRDAAIIAGGASDKSIGYFIQPTVILTNNLQYKTMTTELFGPIVTIYIFDDDNWQDMFDIIDQSSPYALTGAFFSKDRASIELATQKLSHCTGNFYINDKPTGAVVGMQPFGGSRASGTNDKAGSMLNLLRWVSPRVIKETFNPPTDYRYSFLD